MKHDCYASALLEPETNRVVDNVQFNSCFCYPSLEDASCMSALHDTAELADRRCHVGMPFHCAVGQSRLTAQTPESQQIGPHILLYKPAYLGVYVHSDVDLLVLNCVEVGLTWNQPQAAIMELPRGCTIFTEGLTTRVYLGGSSLFRVWKCLPTIRLQ